MLNIIAVSKNPFQHQSRQSASKKNIPVEIHFQKLVSPLSSNIRFPFQKIAYRRTPSIFFESNFTGLKKNLLLETI